MKHKRKRGKMAENLTTPTLTSGTIPSNQIYTLLEYKRKGYTK